MLPTACSVMTEVKTILQAAERGDRKTLQGVIAEHKVGVVDEDGNTALMYAAASGREDILRLLLDKDVRNSPELRTSYLTCPVCSV